MEKINNLLRRVYGAVGPEVRVDDAERVVFMAERLFFANMTETYYKQLCPE